ncbi:hypothetical protein QUF94_14410 [Peribacillus sp. NJ4]|uniref:hypothetical protein n=1 Tax=Peribacillus TaxID=2675229 RepID=UPI0025A1DC0F|nr:MULTISPECIES: hypothetical protein [unclassified Peribacillus]MDM5212618.1 hypothetical protein [Peribacillus sp. NJ4]MDM5222980.1 hypothetical protein [Peribacillus sp. NJ11]
MKFLKHIIFWLCIIGTLFSMIYFFVADVPLYIKLLGGAIILYLGYDLITESKERKRKEALEA